MNYKLKNAYVVIPSNGTLEIEKKDLCIQNGKIVKELNEKDDLREIDCEGSVVMPGLVNAHHHIYSTLSKGIACETPFNDFLGNLNQLWWRLDRSLTEEDMVLSTAITMEDCIKHGVTTVFDHHISIPFIEGSLSKMAEVFTDYGIQGSIAFEISDRNGKEVFERTLNENVRFAKESQNKSVHGMLGLHASFTLSDESLKRASEESGNIPIHIHVAEAEYDQTECRRMYGMSILERLEKFGLLRENSLLVHCSNLSGEDIKLLKNDKLFTVQAIDSNLNNGLNVGDITKLSEEGISCCVGTDGMHSSVLKALKNSFLVTRYNHRSADIGFGEMDMMIDSMYKLKAACGFDLGINVGETADIAVFDYVPPTPIDNSNVMGHFIYGITESRCRYLIKGDEILLDDYKVKKEPYKQLKERAQEISERLFKRFSKQG